MSSRDTTAWASYGYHDKDSHTNQYPDMELRFEDGNLKSSYKLQYPTSRVEKQKQRVFDASLKRMMLQRAQNQRELLNGLNEDSIDGTLSRELLFSDFNDLAAYYDNNKADQPESKRLSKIFSHDSAVSISSEVKRNSSGHTRRIRPRSATVQEDTFLLALVPDSMPCGLAGLKKRSRIQSAPSRRRKTQFVPMATKSTQDYACIYDCHQKQTRSGCLCCPVECRPVSSSSHNQLSSTGLQATDGPSHFQYYHYDKYIRNQRPHTAIGSRIEFLESSGIKRGRMNTPKFSNIVRSCSIHERSNSRSPRSGSPRQAWEEKSHEKFGLTIKPIPTKSHDSVSKRKGSSDSGHGSDDNGYKSGFDEDLKEEDFIENDDDLLNYDVRQQAERSYEIASTEENAMHVVTVPNVNSDIIVNFRTPPSPTSSRSSSPIEETDDNFLPFTAPPPTYTTDLMSGKVGNAESVDELLLSSPTGSDRGLDDFSQIEVSYPDPLPIKRVPHPDIHVVDIVQPREELKFKDYELENLENESTGIPTDRTVTNFSESDPEAESQEQNEKAPVSILKSPSQDFSKEVHHTAVPKVKFDIPMKKEETEPKETDLKSHVFVVSSLAKKEEPKEVVEEPKEAPVEEVKEEEEEKEKEVTPVGVQQVTLTHTDKETDEKVTVVKKSEWMRRKSIDIKPTQAKVELVKPQIAYTEPVDEELKKLLAPPDLAGFETPVFDPPRVKTKKGKKAKGESTGKKKKGKKKKKKKAPPLQPAPSAEPLFTYVPRTPSALDVAKNRLAAMKQEDGDLIDVMAAVSLFDKQCQEKRKSQPWLFGRMALSKQICRFWLPMDLKDLEGLRPADYLAKYCSVCKRRQKLYNSVFERQLMRRKSTKEIQTDFMKKSLNSKDTAKALNSVHANCIQSEHIERVLQLVCISSEDDPCNVARLDSNLFSSVCAFTERLFYNLFVTEDAEETGGSSRHRIEIADFDGLEWKLNSVKITDELRTLLFSL